MINLKGKLAALIALTAITLLAMTTTVFADETNPSEIRTQQDATLDKALDDAFKAATRGPTAVELLDQATLNLPKGYLFVPRKEATALMEASGNKVSSDFFGVIMPETEGFKYILTIDYIKSGYIADDEAKSWNADDLFADIKKGIKAANEDRSAKGFSTLTITGWIEKPTYNATAHKLIWSIEGIDNESYKFVNYNTYALGRDGYFELTLLTSYEKIESSKEDANKILGTLIYNKDKRYEDFVKGTDHLAEYGLAALVTGIAAKKLGLIALAGVFILKIWKAAMVACFVLLGSIKKFFARKNK